MSARTREHANGWACTDCMILLANGEEPPERTEDELRAWHAAITRCTEGTTVTIGRMLGEDGCECPDTSSVDHWEGCERLAFTWSSCDHCGSTLGGERHAVTFWWGERS